MPKKNYRNSLSRLDIKTIIKRLPLHRHLNQSQSSLIDFSNTWESWSNDKFVHELQKSITLNSFQNGVLTIRCISPIAASQLKHQQISLIETFHSAGFNNIEKIKIQIDHDIANYSDSDHDLANQLAKKASLEKSANASQLTHQLKTERKAVLPEAINTIRNCQKSIKNDRLNASLQRLAKTLDNDNKK